MRTLCNSRLLFVLALVGISLHATADEPDSKSSAVFGVVEDHESAIRQATFNASVNNCDCTYDSSCDSISCDGSCGCDSRGGCCKAGSDVTWRVGGGALFMNRSTPDSEVLFSSVLDPTIAINASDFDFDMQTGYELWMRGSVGSSDTGLELRYFAIDDWSGSATRDVFANNLDNTRIGTSPPLDLIASNIAARYSSNLYNYELNLRKAILGDALSFLVGVRHLTLDEQIDSVLTATGIGTTGIRTQTENNLTGFQIGSDARLYHSKIEAGILSIGSQLKTGIYQADMKHRTSVGTNFTPPILSAGNWDDSSAFIGELLFDSSLQMGCFALTLDYRLLWVEGVAIAGDQLAATSGDPLTPAANIDTSGGAFYHGFQVGLEAVF